MTANSPEQDRLEALLNGLKQHFGVELLWYRNLRSDVLRGDVTFHNFFPEHEVTDELRQEIRGWLEDRGWQTSRQSADPFGTGHVVTYIYLAPMVPVDLAIGYHTTRRASVASIMEHGLLPSHPNRQTTERRLDCEGNIYICETLGSPSDVDVMGSESAHWWRGHLSQKNQFNDLDWVILRVEVGRLSNGRMYRDLWSKSGIIIRNVPAVPPCLIGLEYPTSHA